MNEIGRLPMAELARDAGLSKNFAAFITDLSYTPSYLSLPLSLSLSLHIYIYIYIHIYIEREIDRYIHVERELARDAGLSKNFAAFITDLSYSPNPPSIFRKPCPAPTP